MNTYTGSNAHRRSLPVIITGVLVIVMSYLMILSAQVDTGTTDYTSYIVNDSISIYDLARSIASDDANLCEVVYRIRDLNSLDGDYITANTSVRIPSDLIDSSSDCGIYMCSAD